MSKWTFEQRWAAWLKARPTLFPNDRVDCDGRVIRWDEYGQETACGWHVDHVTPVALGGSDELQNLRARHYLGNCGAGGLLGNAMRENRLIRGLGALSPPANAMMGGIGGLSRTPFNAMLAMHDDWLDRMK